MPPLLYGDERRFKQVFIILVRNALKFTTKGFIKILTSYDEEEEILFAQVIDSGAGISAVDLSLLVNDLGEFERK